MTERRSIADLAAQLAEPFKHLVVGQVDEYCAYLTRIEGAYLYHQHPKDEMYLVLEGEMTIDFAEGREIVLAKGDSLVVPAEAKHRSRSEPGALVLIFKARDLFAQ